VNLVGASARRIGAAWVKRVDPMRGRWLMGAAVLSSLFVFVPPTPAGWAAPGGTLDPSFGADGKVLTNFSYGHSFARAVAIQADGKIVAAGETETVQLPRDDFALARYHPDGTLDAGFGAGGKVVTDVSGAGSSDTAAAVAIQPNGKIVVAGYSFAGPGGSNFALARYHRNGRLDAGFGTGGTVLTDVSGTRYDNGAYAVAIQPDSKILTAGYSPGDHYYAFTLVRYQP
jgi:uncharacterized delta-60 repeat protein